MEYISYIDARKVCRSLWLIPRDAGYDEDLKIGFEVRFELGEVFLSIKVDSNT